MRLAFSILLTVLAMFIAGRIGLAEPLRVSTLEAQANAAATSLRSAQAKERKTRDQQAILANKIAALKRERNPDLALLERLLRESIDADRALAAQIEDTQAAFRTLRDVLGGIRARISELARVMSDEQKPLAARKQAAKEIAQLRGIDRGLSKTLEVMKGEARHTEWADHVVAIDPLDGPTELADKDAVLALTQKKIEQKKQLIDRLIREKKIAQAARDFTTDATALDDDLRTGRVNRGSGGNNETLAVGDRNNNAPAPAAPAADANPEAGFAGEVDDQTAPPPAPPLDPNRDGSLGATQPQVGVPNPKTAIQVTPPAGLPSSQVAKQIDPNFLINLREDLDSEAYDLATLKQYLSELESMQKALSTQAQKIKSRAKQLEKDEARTK